MTNNKRILLNVVATYGRSLYALAIGLFCGRWALMALGHVDYGLMGVVGGLTAFIVFINNLLSMSVSRFYAFSVGQAVVAKNVEEGIEECRRWFSIALFVHMVIPFILLLIGYPIGEWAIRNFLVVPSDRIDACVSVFQFVCLSSFVSMVDVPFSAMYRAKQYIAELTIYTFITATVRVVVLYYMITHPGVWLVKFALWECMLSVAPNILIPIRALMVFPECRFRMRYCWDLTRFRELAAYAAWSAYGSLAMLMRSQGIAILVNKYFGPRVNAAMVVANTVNSQTTTLSGAMTGAFSPVITTACGAGDYVTMRKMAFCVCKFGMALSYIFLLPLALELPYVMKLWLKDPPAFSVGLCWIMLLITFLDKQTYGHMLAIMAYGKMAWFQVVVGTLNLMALPLAWLFVSNGANVYFVVWAMAITWALVVYGRLYFAKIYVDMKVGYWLWRIMLPIIGVVLVSMAVGWGVRGLFAESFKRICLTTFAVEAVFMPLLWAFVFEPDEKVFIKEKIFKRLRRS